MAKIKEIKKLSFESLRALCIKNNYYTMGTNEEYSKMLAVTYKENITNKDIYNTAIDIINHSDLTDRAKSYGMSITSNEFIECIMYEIAEKI